MKYIKALLKKTFLYHPVSLLRATIREKEIPLILYSFYARKHKICQNKVIFSSFFGQQFSAQPKMIFDRLLEGDFDEYDIVWIAKEGIIHDNRIRVVPPKSRQAIYELYTAKVWIDNCRKPYWLKKKRGQTYIQTWHGPICLKYVEKDAINHLSPYYIHSAIQDSKNADYIVSECNWRTKNIKQAFWFNKEILFGEFRKSFALIPEEAKSKVLKFYDLPVNTKILTYLPTFRNSGTTEAYLSDYNLIIQTLEKKDNTDHWAIVIRLHPNISEKSETILYSNNILNGTIYPQIEELILASDLVITDYSGCMFEAMRAEKRVILYAIDIEAYIMEDRDLYFDLNKIPPPLCTNMNTLLSTLNVYDWDRYEIERMKFIKDIGYYPDNASDICAEIIKNSLMNRN